GTDNKKWLQYASGGNFYYQLVNDADNSGISWAEVHRTGMTVNSVDFPNGNVGIGTTSPSYLLSLGGVTPILDFYLSTGYGGDGARILATESSNAWNASYLDFQTHAGNTSSFTDDMVIKAGNVGIGTTTPDTTLTI